MFQCYITWNCVWCFLQYVDDDSLLLGGEDLSSRVVLGAFAWGYVVAILPAGLVMGWAGGRKMLGYTHLTMSILTVLTPLTAQFMHVYTSTGLQFFAGLMAVCWLFFAFVSIFMATPSPHIGFISYRACRSVWCLSVVTKWFWVYSTKTVRDRPIVT